MTNCTVVPMSALIAFATLIIVTAANGAQNDQAKSPQISWNFGPLEMDVHYKQTLYKDKLKVNKVTLNYLAGLAGLGANRLVGKVIFREDLVKCNNLLDEAPEIDCKPLDQHLFENSSASHLDNYVRRYTYAMKMKDDLPFWASNRQEHRFHSLAEDYTRLTIDRILEEHNMTRSSLGFDAMSTDFGFFFKSNVTTGKPASSIFCSGNVFIIINQTRTLKPLEAWTDYPEMMHRHDHFLAEGVDNGVFFSIQDAGCSPDEPSGLEDLKERESLDIDLTLIYRKQFPYLTCSHIMKTQPMKEMWSYQGSIKQTKDDSSPEAYRTFIDVESLSALIDVFNFKLIQNFTNFDFTSGSEIMTLFHPLQAFIVKGDWTANSIVKSLASFTFDAPARSGDSASPLSGDPNLMLIYNDNPDSSQVSFTVSVDRNLLNRFLESKEYGPKHDAPAEQSRDEL